MNPHDNSLILYKMIVLYALSRVEHPLTKSQLIDFFLEKDYTDYLTLQSVFAQLTEAGFLSQEQNRNRTRLSLTEEGKNTLSLFDNELTEEIKKDVDQFLRSNALSLRQVAFVTADYHMDPKNSKAYLAELSLKEQGHTLLSFTLSLPTEQLAESVCKKWEACHEDVYSAVMSQLL